MMIIKIAKELSLLVNRERNSGKTIGFVPTMGALHAGHISLIQLCKQQNDLAVCSIFVNPTQFNNPDDFTHYPVTIEKDIEQLIDAGCDILFLPPVEEIYPAGFQKKQYDLGNLENILEGFYRPGHFQGVCQVVDRLLQIVSPHRLYLGQKDYQQCMVIRRLIEILGEKNQPELVISPTVREADGLAMSSRNLRLSPEERQKATGIYKTLTYIKINLNSSPAEILQKEGKRKLEEQGFIVDYVKIADAKTLAESLPVHQPKVALIAATLHNVRLIDNMLLN
jgi:pantoate--beta-alanine ligase